MPAQSVKRLDDLKGRSWKLALLPLPTAHADPSLLEHVYVNLATNSVKFSADSPTIRSGFSEDAEGRAHYVADNGIEFDNATANLIFALFQRLRDPSECLVRESGFSSCAASSKRTGVEYGRSGNLGRRPRSSSPCRVE